MRSQIRRVGFDDQAVLGDQAGDIAQFVRLLESHHAGKTDVEAQSEALLSDFRGASERMHHAAQPTPGVRRPQHFDRRRTTVSHVHDDRQAGRLRQPQMGIEKTLLDVERSEVPVRVQPRLPDRSHRGSRANSTTRSQSSAEDWLP